MAGPSSPPPPPPPPSAPMPPPGAGWTTTPTPPPMVISGNFQSMAIAWGRILGFLFLFIGTLIAVVAGSVQPVCYASSGCTNWPGTWAWAVIIGEVLWVVGLFFLGASSGLQLMRGLKAPAGGTPEEYRWILTERWFNFLMVIVSIVLLWFLIAGVIAIHPGFAGTG